MCVYKSMCIYIYIVPPSKTCLFSFIQYFRSRFLLVLVATGPWEGKPIFPLTSFAQKKLRTLPPLLWCGLWWVDCPSLLPPRAGSGGCRVVWSGGWESPSLLPSCGAGSGGVGSVLGSFGGVGRILQSWASCGREASLVRQTIFCGRKFSSETLGCPFKCFGRPWRFLSGTIQYRVIESVKL